MEQNEEVVQELVNECKRLEGENREMKDHISVSSYGRDKNANLISAQLETQELLEKLERFYKGDYLTSDGDDVVWKSQKNTDLIPLNEYGVNTFMEVVTKYIDKNTTLSNYSEERIFEILADVGDELTLVVYCNYEKMGMDTPFKKTKFRLLVTTTLHLIESTYRRSIGGETSKDLNQSRIVSQSDHIGAAHSNIQQKKKARLLDPRTWGG